MIAIDPEVGEGPSPRRVALAVVGLAWFSISLPLGRVLIDAPEFFIAHRMSPGQVLWFWLIVTLGIPMAAGAVAWVAGAVAAPVRTVLIAVLGALAGAAALQPVSSIPFLFSSGVLAAAVASAWFLPRRASLTDAVAIAACGCVVMAAVVVGPSRTGAYLRSTDVSLEIGASEPGDLTPVVVLVFDEFPVTSLLDAELRVNAERYPNFAALAATSDWFRLASSVSPVTEASVPALLSGTAPDPGRVPVASAYPSNLFLQLGRTHEVHAFESLTALCPPAVCEGGSASPEASDRRDPPPPLLHDVSVVYRHAISSDAVRRSLPSISSSWAAFAPLAVDRDGSRRELIFDRSTFVRETEAMLEVVSVAPSSSRPSLYVAHITAPHAPWMASPDGSTYTSTAPPGSRVSDGVLHWDAGESGRRAGYQRLLLQVGALDRRFGEIRAALEASGTWDRALVVVTADHGSQFEPGYWRDVRAGGVEVTGVPLFVKRPEQTRGRVDDRPALTIDLVPTVLGQLGMVSSSRFAGLDLYRDDLPSERSKAFVAKKGPPVTPDQTLDALRAMVRRRGTWIDPDGGWGPVRQAGVDERVVGRRLEDIGRSSGSGGAWRRATEGGPKISVTVTTDGSLDPATALIACNEVVEAAVPIDPTGEAIAFDAFVDPATCADETLAVAFVDTAGGRHDLRRVP